MCVRECVRACLPACLRACVPACLPACVRACVRVCVSVCLSVCLPACEIKVTPQGTKVSSIGWYQSWIRYYWFISCTTKQLSLVTQVGLV